jgi:RNA polymerase sigma-70 factor (ECF subfamily)
VPLRVERMPALGRTLRLIEPDEGERAPDAVLVARATAGDRAALAAIFHRYAAVVFHLTARLLRDRIEAEDVLQETFEIVLDRLGGLRDPSALRPWILQIAVRQARHRFRRRKLLRALGFGRSAREPDAALELCASENASPEQRAELALLDHSLLQLADEDRLAWMLRHVEGLDLEDVAHACSASLATVKRRIQRADSHVRTRVALDGRDHET